MIAPPTVLLHGFAGGASSFAAVRRHRAPHPSEPSTADSSCVLHSVGHGDAPTQITSFEAEVDRLVELLPAPRVQLIGYSLGARLGLGLLHRAPERFTRALLISMHPGLESDTARRERRAHDAGWCELLETRGIEAFVDAWEAQPIFASQRGLAPEQRAAQRAERLAQSPRGLVASLKSVGLAEMPRFDAPAVPTTLLVGALDAKFVAIAESLAWPRVERRVIPGAGHNLLLEAPEAVAEWWHRAS